MAKRKINRVGTSTLTVSLPSKWTKQYGLKPGDEVDVTEDGSKLTVSTHSVISTPKKVTVHLKSGQPFRRRYLTVMYRDGYDEIEVTSEDPLDQPRLKEGVGELLGFEVIESHPRRILVRNVATPNESEFDNIFRRLFLLNISMAKSILEDIKSGQYLHMKEVAELEHTTNKFHSFCDRVLIKTDVKNRVTTLNMYHFAGMLEQMADHLKHICKTVSAEQEKLSKAVIQSFENMTYLLEQLYKDFYSADPAKLTALLKKRDAIFEEAYGLFYRKGLRGTDLEIAGIMIGILGIVKAIETEMYHL